jgi:hypothetical protein
MWISKFIGFSPFTSQEYGVKAHPTYRGLSWGLKRIRGKRKKGVWVGVLVLSALLEYL